MNSKGVSICPLLFLGFRHDEEERRWLERERIAQQLFAQRKALEEAAKAQKPPNEPVEIQNENSKEPDKTSNGVVEVNFALVFPRNVFIWDS